MSVQNYNPLTTQQAHPTHNAQVKHEDGNIDSNTTHLVQQPFLQSGTIRQASGVKQDEPSKRLRPEAQRASIGLIQPAKKAKTEMQVVFVHGTEDHISTYAHCIDAAESHIIIASWNLNFISQRIFSSLMRAKKQEVSISLVVQSVKREETLKHFYDDEDSDSEYTFNLFITKSHAKFLLIDSKILVLGSYNALGNSYEESLDSSVMLKGSVQQLWPFYMSIYETYTSISENLGGIFGGIAMISKVRNPGPRPLLQRSFEDGSRIFLLRTVQEHQDFFRLATPYNGDVSIYSPFCIRDNTLKRLQTLEKILPTSMKISLKVLLQFRNGLTTLLTKVPNLQNRVNVETVPSHQKVITLGAETICIGSLNWLSAAQDNTASYWNAELSVVLQGPKAGNIIKKFYSVNQ